MPDTPTPNVMAAAIARYIRRHTYSAFGNVASDWTEDGIAAIITRHNADAEREVERYKQYYRRDVCIVGEMLTEIEPLLGLKPTIGDSIPQRVPALGIAIKKLIAEVQLHRKSME